MDTRLFDESEHLLYGRPLGFSDLMTQTHALLWMGIAKRITVSTVVHTAHLPTSLLRAAEGHKVTLQPIVAVSDAMSARLAGRFGRKSPRLVKGMFYAVQAPDLPDVWFVVTDGSADFVCNPLEALLEATKPTCMHPVLRTNQIRGLVHAVEALPSIERVRVRQVGHRARIDSIGASRTVESDRRWTDLQVDEAFAELSATGSWATDVTFTYALGPRVSPMKAAVSGGGRVVFWGSSSPPMEALLPRIAKMADSNHKFLSNRAISRRTAYRSRPFYIDYGQPLLESKEIRDDLIRVLKGMPNTGYTVYHGNPYFHASFLDYGDGSCYEILILDPSQIAVVPQGRTTPAALQRLCTNLFAGFREGELKDIA